MIRVWLPLLLLAGCSTAHVTAPIRDAGTPAQAFPTRLPREAVAPLPTGYYRVQPGDTLYKIAFDLHLDADDLSDWNRLADPSRIRAGELLRIVPPIAASAPGARGGEVRARPAEATMDAVEATAWGWPSKGNLLARFGDGASKGVDIAGRLNQPVLAAASGLVVYAGAGLRGYGKLIIIRHGKTLLSAYAHNARVLVYDGQSVRRGQQIAEMGDSDADRVKLHFEIREHGKPVDPMNYLPKAS